MRDVSKCWRSRAGSLGALAQARLLPQKLEQVKKKTPTEVSIPWPKCLPPYRWLGVLGGEPPSHGAGGFILSAGSFTAPSVWHQKEELYQPGEILILSTPILDFQQLQPVLETLLGGLLGGLFQ